MFIANDLHPNADTLLLGITDSAVEGDWKSFNGNPITYIGPWYGNEPNGGVTENNVVMFTKKEGLGRGGQWNDISGTYTGFSYCTFEPFQLRDPQTQKILSRKVDLNRPRTEALMDPKTSSSKNIVSH